MPKIMNQPTNTKKGKTAPQDVKPVRPVPVPPVVAVTPVEERERFYKKLEAIEYSIDADNGPLTVEDAKDMMGWETEKEYQVRMVKEYGGKPEHYLFGDTGPRRTDTGQFQPVHCTNTRNEKVVCWNNANNRPFDLEWCKDIRHSILSGHWAGPLTIPGETINGETVRISRYKRVLSGQHQLTALILADEVLAKWRHDNPNATPKYPFWEGHDHPVIETFVMVGLSEDERVLRTIDYVKPRTTADMLYTMELFRSNTPAERKEMTRMLAAAIDLLWHRTDTKGYKTHPEVVGFLERHQRLLKCVEHLFVLNRASGSGDKKRLENETDEQYQQRIEKLVVATARKISSLYLNPGHCAAICFLMGCSADETTQECDSYRDSLNTRGYPPNEKDLDWSLWDDALMFWTKLARDPNYVPVRRALGRLKDTSMEDEDNMGLGGRAKEKLAILSKAWDHVKHHPEEAGDPFLIEVDGNGTEYYPDMEEGGCLFLSYTKYDANNKLLPDGKVNLVDVADFEGIDCPENTSKGKTNKQAEPAPAVVPPREMEEARKRHQEKHFPNKQEKPSKERGSLDELAERAAANSARDRAAKEVKAKENGGSVPSPAPKSAAKKPVARKK